MKQTVEFSGRETNKVAHMLACMSLSYGNIDTLFPFDRFKNPDKVFYQDSVCTISSLILNVK
ncbi:hypothetical protein DVH24_018988 [Malus domestica]|uniref:Uncharacterized protein n=1 Tax=Malus domestica TaxID=3750 RepID=A0A498HZ44_MALDO|nr:hypothetical protein DVH24_018988 [Malus domestica]